MEQARYWIWTKRKEPSYDDSWEEQAFAEDTNGSLGGCVWPPRSYSCNFCRREFRSAQALGGHMNVHRRDRARLKQSPTPQIEILSHDHPNHYNTYPSLGFQYQPQICSLVYCSPNPSSDLGSIVSPSSPSRISTIPFSSSITEEEQIKSSSPISSKPLCPHLDAEKCYLSKKNLMSNNGENVSISSSRSIDEFGRRAKVDYLKTDLSVNLNLVARQACPITILDDKEEKEKEETNGRKRRRIDSAKFFCKSNNSVDCHSCSIEELDLELRLGEPIRADLVSKISTLSSCQLRVDRCLEKQGVKS